MTPFYDENESTPDRFDEWFAQERGSSEFDIEADVDFTEEDDYSEEDYE